MLRKKILDEGDLGALAAILFGAMRNLEEFSLHSRNDSTQSYLSRVLSRSIGQGRLQHLSKVSIEGLRTPEPPLDRRIAVFLVDLVDLPSLTEVRLRNVEVFTLQAVSSHLPLQWKSMKLEECTVNWHREGRYLYRYGELDGLSLSITRPSSSHPETGASMSMQLLRCKHRKLEQGESWIHQVYPTT